MNSRPLFHARIADLESDFDDRRGDTEYLKILLHELEHRSSDRAVRLRARVAEALAASRRPSDPRIHGEDAPRGTRRERAEEPRPDLRRAGPGGRGPQPPTGSPPAVTNAPESILDTWVALEVLSPPTFRRPEDLSGGNRSAIAWLDRNRLPWEGAGERARRNTRLYYQVVLGSVDLDAAVSQLLERYTDTRAERPAARGEAILAVVILDRSGRPVESPAAVVSSFAWGLPHALRGELRNLAGWSAAERALVEGLDRVLRRPDEEGEPRPLDGTLLGEAFRWLVDATGVPRDLVHPPRIAIRSYEHYRSSDPPEPLLLNSFFLGDLAAAKSLVREDRAPGTLRRFLGIEVPSAPRNLLRDRDALADAVAPERTPPARWTGPGRHPLVLLQQAAVNLATSELRGGGIVAVNGPPGTGKTTLLRDMVAALVTERAEAMATFDDPENAFSHSGERMKAGQAWLHLYRVDPRLRGFEILVASSNNKAVENVSAELPAIDAIAEDAHRLRYFSTLSDTLLDRETWGLIAAVLGNAANRARFRQTFWWDDEVGLSKYLAAAAGTPQLIEAQDATTGERVTRPPRIVSSEDPPADHRQALRRWELARSAFGAKLRESRQRLKELARSRLLAAELASLAGAEADAGTVLARAREEEQRLHVAGGEERRHVSAAQDQVRRTGARLAAHDRQRPGLLARLFRTARARSWLAARAPLVVASVEAQKDLKARRTKLALLERELRDATVRLTRAEEKHSSAAQRHAAAREQVERIRGRLGAHFADAAFFAREHGDLQQATAWLTKEEQLLRDEVFCAAIALHKAFIDAAAKPLRHNLGVLMNGFGRGLPAEKQRLVPDLWTSLFLVVPLVSTTFASVERMLGTLPPESLSWLLVDEAGQAVPQAAVGALLRTRRAVVVGDPMQIEPVVVLPDTLVHAIARYFGVDPDRFAAPRASAQTLADAATAYIAEFEERQGSRTVGVPLLVHRRCVDPMFRISNAIAYQGLMVQARTPRRSPIGEVLGPSAWIDVVGSAEEKWSPEEGAVALDLLRRLAAARISPDLYVVTPFVVVADQLRRLVRESGILEAWTDDAWRWTAERIGTVHTVQGREAEAVIFVLGAPAPQQTGARGWAGGRPNLLNVAVSRAKERLYVIGNRRLWRTAGVFRELDARLG